MNQIAKTFFFMFCLGLSSNAVQAMDEATQNVINLVKAAYNGETETVKGLLPTTNPNEFVSTRLLKVKTIPPQSFNALSAASYNGKKGIVELLLNPEPITPKEKININAASNMGYSALWVAANQDHIEIAKLLLEAKANPNQQDKSLENTPLHQAALKDYIDIVKLLLEYKADKNLQNKAGQTPLQVAEFYKRNEIIELLKKETPEENEYELPIEEDETIIEDIVEEEEKEEQETEVEKKKETPKKPSEKIITPTETDLLGSLSKLQQSLLSLTTKL